MNLLNLDFQVNWRNFSESPYNRLPPTEPTIISFFTDNYLFTLDDPRITDKGFSIRRYDGQPDTGGNQPPLPWEQWTQEKRNKAVDLLIPDDWTEFITSMPDGGELRHGDRVEAPGGGIIIPEPLFDNPVIPGDERQAKPGLVPDFTNPPDFDFDGEPDETDTDDDNDGTPDTSDPEPSNPNVPVASENPPEPSPEPTPEPYVNNNPRATPDEVRVGEYLDGEAQADRLPRAARVEGAGEIPGEPSGDYRFIEADGTRTAADLYQPESGNPGSISRNIIEKGRQAQTVVVELGAGQSGQIDAEGARSMAQSVMDTPDHGVDRVIVIKDSQIIVDYSR